MSSVEDTNIKKGRSIVTVYSNLIRSFQVGTEEEGKSNGTAEIQFSG